MFFRFLFPVFLTALAFFAARAGAVELSVNDFRTHFSNQAADTANLDPSWGDTLRIASKLIRPTAMGPFLLSDALNPVNSIVNGRAGSTPNLISIVNRQFRCGYVSWELANDIKFADDGDYTQPTHVVYRDLYLGEGSILRSNARKIAGNEIRRRAVTNRYNPPDYFHFLGEGSRYAAYWTNTKDLGEYIRTTTHVQAAGGGDPDTWGRHMFNAGPTDTVRGAGWGKFGAAIIPGTGGNRTVLAYESRVTVPVRTLVRWSNLDDGTFDTTSFVHGAPAFQYGQDYALAADSAGNVLVLWREGPDNANTSDLWVAVLNASRAVTQPPVLLQSAVALNEGPAFPYVRYRAYSVTNVNNGNFLVAYAKGGSAYFQAVAVPHGAQPFSAGPSVQLSAAGDIAYYPGIAVNRSHVLFGWIVKIGGSYLLKTALYGRSGGGVDVASRQSTLLPTEPVSFDSAGSGWSHYHYFKPPSLALDSAGNMAVAWDHNTHSRLALVANFQVFHDSAVFVSKSLTAADFASAVPILPGDSLHYLGARVVARASDGTSAPLAARFAISADGSFTDPGSGFAAFPTGRRAPVEAFKYRFVLAANGPDFITQTKADSLILRYNVKPRRPAIDSIRIGAAARSAFSSSATYSVMPRRDSVHLVVSGVDVEDGPPMKFYLSLGGKVADSAVSTKTATGSYRARFSFLPSDTLPNPLPVAIHSKDSADWASLPLDFRPVFGNFAPAETVTVVRHRGRDSLGVFRPIGGLRDTLVPDPAQPYYAHAGDDSAQVEVRTGDINDDSLTFRLLRNGAAVLTRRIAAGSILRSYLAADTLAPIVDTVAAELSDPDTTVVFRFLIRPNRLPRLDSLALASYKARDSSVQRGPFDRLAGAGDTGLVVPIGLPAVLKAWHTEPDQAFGDGLTRQWTVYSAKAGCAQGDLACYDVARQATGDSLVHTFVPAHQYLVLRAYDGTGAWTQRRVRMEYPIFDTAGTAGLTTAIKALDSLDFILGSDHAADTVQAVITNSGNVPLQVFSVATRGDDRKWLDLRLDWEAPGTPPFKDSLKISGRTDSNAVPGGDPLYVAPGARLTLTFAITSDSLRGDSVFIDTVVLRTNDLANPLIRIPIRMEYNDLPVLSLGTLAGASGAPGGPNDRGLPAVLPTRAGLVFAFSETVRIPAPGQRIRVYSYLDSLVTRNGINPIPGDFEFRRRALPKGLPGRRGSPEWGLPAGAKLGARGADSLADTLVFRPAYARPSDSLKVLPPRGAFIHGDVLRISVSNGVVDRAGNPLDLRLDKRAAQAGSLDTTWQAQVDTGAFRVVSIVPAAGRAGWDPEQSIRVRFNRSLGLPPPRGSDTLTALRFDTMRGDSNHSVRIRSAARANRPYDLQFLALEEGDSTLVFRSRPKLAAFDTVTVTLSGALASADGLTLDGNLDGFPSRFYNPGDYADSTDDYSWTFLTREQEFYVFPNPFRHSDPRHREKGAVTFKNINMLPGFNPARETLLRIHTLTGDLVFDSRSAGRPTDAAAWASMDWDLRNTAGRLAGTGVYIFTLLSGNSKVLRKGKVAIIR